MVAHPTSSVYGAGAAGPAMISGRDTSTRVDYSEPSLAQARDTPNRDSPDPSLVTTITGRHLLSRVDIEMARLTHSEKL